MRDGPTELATGIVLAGGASRRMGRDKASLDVNGETLLARTVRVMQAATAEVLVVGRKRRDVPAGARAVPDAVPGKGPLGGIATGLGEARFPSVAVVACDLPFLQAGIIRLLLDRLPGYDAAVPRFEGRRQPTLAAYRRDVVGQAVRQLAAGDLRLADLLARIRVVEVDEATVRRVDPSGLCFLNINTPEDWAAAQAALIR